MTTLIELAEQCEKLTGPCRETDGLIFKALEQREEDMWTTFGDDEVWHRQDPNDHCAYDPPPLYTASLDVAMTLRLDWMSIELCESAVPASSPELRFTRCRIWDWRRGPLAIDPNNEWKAEGNRPLPLNMCSAILRARATLDIRP
jgi:hypothetical protein